MQSWRKTWILFEKAPHAFILYLILMHAGQSCERHFMQDNIATVQMFKTFARKYNLQFYLFHTPVIFVLDKGYQNRVKCPV